VKGTRNHGTTEKIGTIRTWQPRQADAQGALSKTTKTAKEAIALATPRVWVVHAPDRLAQEDPLNERAFWSSIYPKLLPLQVTGEGGGPIEAIGRIELVGMSGKRPD
jgi:hypothetical protein